MNQKINTLLKKLPGPNKWLFWMVLALLVKSFFFVYKVCLEPDRFVNSHYDKSFAAEAPDTYSYLAPIEGLLKNGHYYDSEFEDFRMPGYGWIYWILRLFLPFYSAANALVLIQLALSAISVYVLAQIALMIFKEKRYFYLTFGLYAISTFVSLSDHALLTESFCTSSFIFSLYFLLKSKESVHAPFLSSLFLTWCIFLRPVMALLFILYALYLLWAGTKKWQGLSRFNWKGLVIFLIPFIIIDGSWVCRNYYHYNRIIPLTKSIFYSRTENSYLIHFTKFMQSYGGSSNRSEPGSDALFFRPRADFKIKAQVRPPGYIYTSKFNYDSLVALRDAIAEIDSKKLSGEELVNKELYVSNKFDAYAQSIKEEKPFVYQVRSRINLFKTFLVQTGTHNLFYRGSSELNKIELLAKLFYTMLYFIVIIGGFAGSSYLLLKGFKNIDYLVISLGGLYFAFVFPVLLRMDEIRYFVPGYPLFLLSSVFVLIGVSNKFTKKTNG